MIQFSTSMSGFRRPQSSGQIIRDKMQTLRREQNLSYGILGGLFAGSLGAVLWAGLSYLTHLPLSWMAIIVAFMAGFSLRLLGKGIDRGFGIIGAVITLLCILLGNFLVSLTLPTQAAVAGFFPSLVHIDASFTLTKLIAAIPLFDVLFYAIAITLGYSTSFRRITREQLLWESILRSIIRQ